MFSHRQLVLVLPNDGTNGVPVRLYVTQEEVVIHAGLAGRLTLPREHGDEDEHVAEVVSAIINGGAVEQFFANSAGDLSSALSVQADWGSHADQVSKRAVASWSIPAWVASDGSHRTT